MGSEMCIRDRHYKHQAMASWSQCMGDPPKHVCASIRGRMRKGVRIGDCMVYFAPIDSCARHLPAIREAFATSALAHTHRCITVSVEEPIRDLTCEDGEHLAALQYATTLSDMGSAVGCVWEPCDSQEVAATTIQAYARRRFVRAELRIRTAECDVVVGKVFDGTRAAVILYDSQFNSVMLTCGEGHPSKGKGSVLAYPSYPVEVDTDPFEAALRGLDGFLGGVLRKGGHSDIPSPYTHCPCLLYTSDAADE